MSRQIDVNGPISEEHREYLEARPWLYRGRTIEDLEFLSEELEDPEEDLEDYEDEEEPEDEELDLDEDEEDDEEVDLDELTIPQLREIAEERGIELPNKIKKEDLLDLLS